MTPRIDPDIDGLIARLCAPGAPGDLLALANTLELESGGVGLERERALMVAAELRRRAREAAPARRPRRGA